MGSAALFSCNIVAAAHIYSTVGSGLAHYIGFSDEWRRSISPSKRSDNTSANVETFGYGYFIHPPIEELRWSWCFQS